MMSTKIKPDARSFFHPSVSDGENFVSRMNGLGVEVTTLMRFADTTLPVPDWSIVNCML